MAFICCFQMSESNYGAIFMIGHAERILSLADDSQTSYLANISSVDLVDMSDQEFINFAKQDGATVIDATGQFRGCTLLLRPDASTQADIDPGKGARHSVPPKSAQRLPALPSPFPKMVQ